MDEMGNLRIETGEQRLEGWNTVRWPGARRPRSPVPPVAVSVRGREGGFKGRTDTSLVR